MDPVSLIWQVFRYAGIALEVINDIFNTEPLDLGDRWHQDFVSSQVLNNEFYSTPDALTSLLPLIIALKK